MFWVGPTYTIQSLPNTFMTERGLLKSTRHEEGKLFLYKLRKLFCVCFIVGKIKLWFYSQLLFIWNLYVAEDG